jgi:hypothetical protein
MIYKHQGIRDYRWKAKNVIVTYFSQMRRIILELVVFLCSPQRGDRFSLRSHETNSTHLVRFLELVTSRRPIAATNHRSGFQRKMQ